MSGLCREMSHLPSKTTPCCDHPVTTSLTRWSEISWRRRLVGPWSGLCTARTGIAATRRAGNARLKPANAVRATTRGTATAALLSTHPSSDHTAESAAAPKASCRPITAGNCSSLQRGADPSAPIFGLLPRLNLGRASLARNSSTTGNQSSCRPWPYAIRQLGLSGSFPRMNSSPARGCFGLAVAVDG